ncbi:MAG: phosphatidate cytidylyltransferase [Gemmataceae bacterium]
MLSTRLWVGFPLAGLVLFFLFADVWWAPWYPACWVIFTVGVLVGGFELNALLPPKFRSPGWLILLGLAVLVTSNWVPHIIKHYTGAPPPWDEVSHWAWVLGAFAGFFLLVFLREMDNFQGPDDVVVRMAGAVWIATYLGLLPSFLIQLRWLKTETVPESLQLVASSVALMMAISIPKACDVGAYFAGKYLTKYLGRHRLTPNLSPKKTWQGVFGGLIFATLMTALMDTLAPVQLLRGSLLNHIGFGVTVGGAGILGDLAESLIKRDCERKDASHVVPGFGGVLDVIDAVLFAAPIAYLWFFLLRAFEPPI